MPRAIILIDHGSKRESANAMLESVADLVRERGLRNEPDLIVRVAHMELAEPSLAEAVASAVAGGATEIVVHPYFLATGRHVTEDIPRLADEVRAQHPSLVVRVTPPIGVHPLIADVVLARARE